jgi:hypothetical protein
MAVSASHRAEGQFTRLGQSATAKEGPRTLLLTDIIPAPGVVDQRREPSLAGECPIGRALILDQPQAQTVIDGAGSFGVVIGPFGHPAGLCVTVALGESILQDSDARAIDRCGSLLV